MKIDDKYSINLIVANDENGVFGDIYDNYSECKMEHPNDPVMFGYEIINDETGENVIEEDGLMGMDEWYDSAEEAIFDWSNKLRGRV